MFIPSSNDGKKIRLYGVSPRVPRHPDIPANEKVWDPLIY
jgi:hypothetical protein